MTTRHRRERRLFCFVDMLLRAYMIKSFAQGRPEQTAQLLSDTQSEDAQIYRHLLNLDTFASNYFYHHFYIDHNIDDIVVFNYSLNEHIEYLHQIFELFERLQVILKVTKLYVDYFSVTLLNQYIFNFDLTTIKKKTVAILNLKFSSTLRELERYLRLTD